ncbi:hypothetical protein [Aeromonas salmonicida]|uniref:hypothetical protein n=1 Tax=Aeromonas salmonicida TaxID=645 RepID=UPI00223EEA6B|nr:hypothetical protein [Aeromonas salmonicida]
MMRNCMALLALGLTLGTLTSGCADIKEAGRTVGHTTRDVTREIGHGTRDTVKKIGDGLND